MRNDTYIAALHHALLSFQMIEEGLKACVGMSHEIIQETTPLPTVFNFDRKAIVEAPLGRLITMFSRVSQNADLVKELRKIAEWRDFCAHNAFRHEMYSRTGSSDFSAHSAQDMATVTRATALLVERIAQEVKAIREQHGKFVKRP